MKKMKNKKKTINSHIILSIIFIIALSTIMGLVFRGSELFSSFPYYIKYTSFGYALGFAFGLGHWAIGTYTEKKLNWTKNPKKANIISTAYLLYTCNLFSFPVKIFRGTGAVVMACCTSL